MVRSAVISTECNLIHQIHPSLSLRYSSFQQLHQLPPDSEQKPASWVSTAWSSHRRKKTSVKAVFRADSGSLNVSWSHISSTGGSCCSPHDVSWHYKVKKVKTKISWDGTRELTSWIQTLMLWKSWVWSSKTELEKLKLTERWWSRRPRFLTSIFRLELFQAAQKQTHTAVSVSLFLLNL